MPRPTRLRSTRACAGCRFERFSSLGHSRPPRPSRGGAPCEACLRATGSSSCSRVLPIRPSPSARSVPRWRGDWPIALPVWVSLSFGIARSLASGSAARPPRPARLQPRPRPRPRLLDRPRRLGSGSTSRIDLPRARATSSGRRRSRSAGLGGLQHVDRVRRAERLREHVADAAELEHGAHAAAGDDAGAGRGRAQQHARRAEAAEHLVRDRLAVLRARRRGSSSRRRRPSRSRAEPRAPCRSRRRRGRPRRRSRRAR